MSQVLYLKWRPLSWGELVGQDHVVRTLHNAVQSDRVSHAYLFSGPRGTGKTSTARILAKAVNCLDEDLARRPCNECAHCQAVNRGEFLDLIEIDAASNTSVEDVRDLRDKINFSPNRARFKVYIIDEVHMLSQAAFNALLKTLEEPPDHALFVLATTEVHKIPPTVLSRCQRHEFRRIPVQDIVGHLQGLADSEGLEVEDEALTLIAKQATGSLRDGISMLDQLASAEGRITLDLAHQVLGTATDRAVLELMDALLAGDAGQGLDIIQAALEGGSNPRHFARQVISYLRNVLLLKMGNKERVDITTDAHRILEQHAQAVSVQKLLAVIKAFNQATLHKSGSWQPSLPLEMAFIEVLDGERGEAQEAGPGPKKKGAVEEKTPARPSRKRVKESVPDATYANTEEKQQEEPAKVEPQESKAKPPQTQQTDPQPANPPPQKESGPSPHGVQVLRKWEGIVEAAREFNPTTQALLNSCTPLGLEDGCLVLSFKHELIKSKMENGDHLQICQDVIDEVVGEEYPIKCVIGRNEGKDIPQDVDPDGLVATTVRELGGKYVSDDE